MQSLRLPEGTRLLDFNVADGTIYALTDKGIYTSQNGVEWERLRDTPTGATSIAARRGTVLVGTNGARFL